MPEPMVPPEPPLIDGVVTLRPFVPADLPAVYAACQDPEIQRWIPMLPAPYTDADARRYLFAAEQAWQDGTAAELAIVDAGDGRLLGSIGLHCSANPRRYDVGYWVAREARGRGVATRALRLVSRWAFERLGVQRLALWTKLGNTASQKVAERCGFRYEGILRGWDTDREGNPLDVVMFALTRADLAEVRESDETAEGRDASSAGRLPRIAETPPELRAPGTRAAPFVELAPIDELPPGSMRRLTLAGLDLLVAHTPAGIVVTDDRCPHMAAPLSIGTLDGCTVACPLHEGLFDLCTGETERMPTTGGLDADGRYHQPWSSRGGPPKADPPGKKLEARRLTRVNRMRYYPARIVAGRLEAQLPFVPE